MATKTELEQDNENLRNEIRELKGEIKQLKNGTKTVESNFVYPATTIYKEGEVLYFVKIMMDMVTGEGKVIERNEIKTYDIAHMKVSEYISQNIILKLMRGEKL